MERIYETMFIVDPTLEDEERESVVDTVRKVIDERVGGMIESVDRWGIRKLAFKIRRFTEGDYTVILFRADPERVKSLEDFYQITPQIFRWQTFRRMDLEKEKRKAVKEKEEEKVGETGKDAEKEEKKHEERRTWNRRRRDTRSRNQR